ncbi:hypothetical protein B0H19DRAFT_1384822 [Mycena capillaripes]|nr:hypothetical protein B0H19DRAFT_1384822 [Mycena capillaripes]
MYTLPQELIRAIVEEIHDAESLKMCSLVGTIFREHTQRILLHSLTLGDDGNPPTAAWTLLQESPHVARYFKRLECMLPTKDTGLAEVHALCAVLNSLSSVRQCYFVGGTDNDPHPWPEVPPQVAPVIIGFIQRQPLEKLHFISISSLSTGLLSILLCAAPTLSLVDTSLDRTVIAVVFPRSSSIVQNLLLLSCPGVADLFSSPEFRPLMASIQKLWWEPALESGDGLISVVAHTIEHIRLHCTDDEKANISRFLPFPPLPSLKLAEIVAHITEGDEGWFIALLSSILAAATGLREICVMCYHSCSFTSETLATVDSLLADSGASPHIRWRVDLDDADTPGVSFGDVATSVQQGMPRLLGVGKVVVEQGSFVGEGFDPWIIKV